MSFYDKVAAVQSELEAPKSRYNKFGGFSYRSLEDILSAAKPILKKHGLLLNISDDIHVIEDGNQSRVYVKAIATVTDGEHSLSSTAYARETFQRRGMDDAQVTGTASSYARKYAVGGLLLVDDGVDDESQHGTESQPVQQHELSHSAKRAAAKKASAKKAAAKKSAPSVLVPQNKELWERAKSAFRRDGNLDNVKRHIQVSPENEQKLIAEVNDGG